ncbi:unnamed protein product, partial [Linum tenue]
IRGRGDECFDDVGVVGGERERRERDGGLGDRIEEVEGDAVAAAWVDDEDPPVFGGDVELRLDGGAEVRAVVEVEVDLLVGYLGQGWEVREHHPRQPLSPSPLGACWSWRWSYWLHGGDEGKEVVWWPAVA